MPLTHEPLNAGSSSLELPAESVFDAMLTTLNLLIDEGYDPSNLTDAEIITFVLKWSSTWPAVFVANSALAAIAVH